MRERERARAYGAGRGRVRRRKVPTGFSLSSPRGYTLSVGATRDARSVTIHTHSFDSRRSPREVYDAGSRASARTYTLLGTVPTVGERARERETQAAATIRFENTVILVFPPREPVNSIPILSLRAAPRCAVSFHRWAILQADIGRPDHGHTRGARARTHAIVVTRDGNVPL